MKLYNTLTGQEEEFVPADGNTVKMYICGVTPYSSTHVGHALSYVIFDVLRRYLEHIGYQVQHVQNFTDVDDKIILRARLEGISEDTLTERYIGDFFSTMDALNIQRAHAYPRATQEIPGIIKTIKGLIEQGYAYPVSGNVYFRVKQKHDYGKLSHRTLEGMIAGARIQVDEEKEHPMDFALWKGAKAGEPSWDSPWGPGRPGWHIECTSMALDRLGDPLDIHGGGQDLVFPHHENEIAQSEAFTGRQPFARYWVHNGLLQLGEDKMSKSLGNLVSVEDALVRYSPDALRLYFLSSHYRSPLTYTDDAPASMERSSERFHHALRPCDNTGESLNAAPFADRFKNAMDNDLNTPQAIAALFDLAREMNRSRGAGLNISEAQETLRGLGGVLGLTFQERNLNGQDLLSAQPFIQMLLDTRDKLRSAKQFELADQIRDGLAGQGIVLKDSAQGTQWQHQPGS